MRVSSRICCTGAVGFTNRTVPFRLHVALCNEINAPSPQLSTKFVWERSISIFFCGSLNSAAIDEIRLGEIDLDILLWLLEFRLHLIAERVGIGRAQLLDPGY